VFIFLRNQCSTSPEYAVPISTALSTIIIKQIDHTNGLENEFGGNEHCYLFVHAWRGKIRTCNLRTFNRYIKEFSENIALKDELGMPKHITSHMFRHTVGTNLINNGMSQLFVQKYLGHQSAQMTAVYAQIHDTTLKEALKGATNKMVDIKGNFYEIEEVIIELIEDDSVTLDAQWLQRHISAQALPNGICTLPVRQSCPHANACLTCPSFRTDNTFLPAHKEQLARCISIINSSDKLEFTRQKELNQSVANNLNTIIEALESD